jgi:hypothetical protein
MSRREFTSQKALQDHAEQTGQVCVLEGIALRQAVLQAEFAANREVLANKRERWRAKRVAKKAPTQRALGPCWSRASFPKHRSVGASCARPSLSFYIPMCLWLTFSAANRRSSYTLQSFFATTRATRQLRHGQEFSEQHPDQRVCWRSSWSRWVTERRRASTAQRAHGPIGKSAISFGLLKTRNWGAYSSVIPTTLPVFGLTRCNCWQARHVNDRYVSSPLSDTSSANHPCTR